ncbi:MAG: AhpC/TSA family protein [Bacteroidales bacterium]|nr:AhpC/TSA family protein [Bacteroidales bacterium]MBO5262912.1 AhpC/TSA family protein [Bacteroidaceae bacterium]
MNRLHIKLIKFAMAAMLAASFAACNKEPGFTIEGEVKEGEGKMLYLSHIGIGEIKRIDSTRLGKSGRFSFTQPRPECYDFYALNLQDGGRRITIAIDSTETVDVQTVAGHFADSCHITGSPESQRIKELTLLENSLQQQVNLLVKNSTPAIGETREKIYNLIGEFKKNIFAQYIATAPQKAAAYYALFLRINGEPIFLPTSNRFDSRCFAAVANSLHLAHPHATRAIHLYNIATKGMAATRPAAPRDTIDIESDKVEKIGLYNIELPDIDGDTVSLRSLKGKVVLLDFTVYSIAGISSRNVGLREIYDKYRDRGFEVYQVSFDRNENFWSNSADNLPWICVRDEAGQASQNLLLYNISELPTYYLINRNNEIVYRDNQINDLEKTIRELLNE